LPHGDYEIRPDLKTGLEATIEVHIRARQVSDILLTLTNDSRSGFWTSRTVAEHPDLWGTSLPRPGAPAESFSLGGTLLTKEPAAVAQQLDFTGAQNTRIPLVSYHTFALTASTFSLEGMKATDPYQPGRALVFPDVAALDGITVSSQRASGVPGDFGVETGLSLRTASKRWHGELASRGTGAMLTSSNLPIPAHPGILQQPQQFN
jgi:hypothetical protein